MKEQEARRLLLYTVVEWTGDNPDDDTAGTLGTVMEIGYRGLLIRWEDGQTGRIAFEDMTRVEIH